MLADSDSDGAYAITKAQFIARENGQDLALDGPDDVGRGGQLLPSTSADLYFAELLRWFGVSGSNMSYVLPNVANFWKPNSASLPPGFINV